MFISGFLIPLCFLLLLRFYRAIGQRTVRHAFAFTVLPRAALEFNAVFCIQHHQLMASDCTIELVNKELKITVAHCVQTSCQTLLKTRRIIIAILQ